MAELLKDIFFTSESIHALSGAIQNVHTAFDIKDFEKCVHDDEWNRLELKQKMRKVT